MDGVDQFQGLHYLKQGQQNRLERHQDVYKRQDFICEVICSYIGLLELLLIIISTKPSGVFYSVLAV